MKCPKCESERTHFATKTTSNGPSFVNGCCGWILLGPVGLLCSFCGMSSDTEEFWVCDSCGSKFQGGKYESKVQSLNEDIHSIEQEVRILDNSIGKIPKDLEGKCKTAGDESSTIEKRYNKEVKEFERSSVFLRIVNL